MCPYTEITCPQLEAPENGRIEYSSYSIGPQYDLGVIATYSCTDGFSLENGDRVRYCRHDGMGITGEWSGTAPECVGE